MTLTLLPILQSQTGQMRGSTTVMTLSLSLSLAIVVDEQRYLHHRAHCPPRVRIARPARHSHHVRVALLKKHSFHALALCSHPILVQQRIQHGRRRGLGGTRRAVSWALESASMPGSAMNSSSRAAVMQPRIAGNLRHTSRFGAVVRVQGDCCCRRPLPAYLSGVDRIIPPIPYPARRTSQTYHPSHSRAPLRHNRHDPETIGACRTTRVKTCRVRMAGMRPT